MKTESATNAPKKKAPAQKPVSTPVVAATTTPKPEKKKFFKPDRDRMVEVRSCYYGQLIYKSSTGKKAVWDGYGLSQFFTVEELIQMRNEQVAFFQNNWIIIADDEAEELLTFLRAEKFYMNLGVYDNLDEVFEMGEAEMKDFIISLTPVMRENVQRRAYTLIKEGTLDSVKKIRLLEEVFECEFD